MAVDRASLMAADQAMAPDERAQAPVIRPAVPTAARAGRTDGLISTAVDEVLLGVLSLALALVLIRGASKAEYGVFALVCTIMLLFRGAQTSLVLTPLATLGGRLRGAERISFVRSLSRLQAGLGVVLALAVTGAVLIVAGGEGWSLAVGSGLALAGAWLREFRRGAALLDGRAVGALVGDTVFAALAAAMTFAPWLLTGSVSAGGVLAAMGLAAGIAAVVGFPGNGAPAAVSAYRGVARAAIEQARWTLPGAAIGWGQQSGYIYAIGLVLGTAAVGEVIAARLFVIPLMLVAAAWSRMFLPRASALVADGGDAVLVTRCGRALKIAVVGSTLYVVVLVGALLFGFGRVLPADYEGCEVQILVWAAFAVTNLARSIAVCGLMARLEFRVLFVMNIASAILSVLLVLSLIYSLGSTGAIIGLTAGELLLALLGWWFLLGRRRT